MKRRDFFRTAAFAGLASLFSPKALANVVTENELTVASSPDLVAVMGGEPEVMLIRALKEMGGIQKFVKKGQKVVIKPNIGWDRSPEMAANTNPQLVGALVKQCKAAGAKEVLVFDHTCDNWQRCYDNSGIKAAVKAAGGKIIPGNFEASYREVDLPKGVRLSKTKVHEAILDCDVWFNVPVLKHHGGPKMSISMKNLMGIIWDRGYWHRNDLHQCIADFATFHKKPVLNIVDAYRIMKDNGPQGRSIDDAVMLKSLLVSPDIVAVDTAAVKLFTQVRPTELSDVRYIGIADGFKVGTQNLDKLNIKRIKL